MGAGMARDGLLQGRRILVVEDEFLVAQSLMDILEAEEATVVGPLGWLDEALVFLGRDSALDGAVLDVNLHGQASYPIADALIERGIRFVFTTGYDVGALNESYRAYPRCEKPLHEQALIAALTRVPT
jgi:two-component SAPR family response regulator